MRNKKTSKCSENIMNRIPVLLHKPPSAQAFCSWWGVEESGSPPQAPQPSTVPPVSPYRGQPQECEPLSRSCKVLTRRSASVYTHVALLSQLHLAFSPFLLHLLLDFFLPLSSSFLTAPLPLSLLFFSQHEGSLG